jgi:hypothetical protein
MADKELQELCARIYRHHKQAIDILIENIPNQRAELAEYIRTLIEVQGFDFDDSNNTYIRFIPRELDLPFFRGESTWTTSKRLILFEFVVTSDSILLILQMGPGPAWKRQAIHRFASENKPILNPRKTLNLKYCRLFSMTVLSSEDYEADVETRKETIKTHWENFLKKEYLEIRRRILENDWPTDG